MSNQWYVRRDGKIDGPLSNAELRLQAASGLITPQTEVCQAAGGNWIAASRIRDLFMPISEEFPAPPPLPAIVPVYAAPPPLPATTPEFNRSVDVAVKNDPRPMHEVGATPSTNENVDNKPWYAKLIGFLGIALAYWLVRPSGCRQLVNDWQKKKPPAKAQVLLLDAEDAKTTRCGLSIYSIRTRE